MKKLSKTTILSVLLLIVLGFLVYSNTFTSSFQYDDKQNIVNNEKIRDIRDVNSIWNIYFYPTRFVSFFTFAMNYHFNRLAVFGYHLVNWILHVINAILVMLFISQILSISPEYQDKISSHGNNKIAIFVALLFLVHPIQTEAVTYITQRFTLLATFFYLLCMCFYIAGRMRKNNSTSGRAIYFGAAFLSAILSMFSKETAISIPISLVLLEIFFLKERQWISADGNNKRVFLSFVIRNKYILIASGLLVIASAVFLTDPRNILFRQVPSYSHDGDIVTSWKYLLTQFQVLPTYIRLLLLPVEQNVEYDFPLAQGISQPSVILGIIFIVSLVFCAFKLFKKHRAISFGIFFFFVALIPESSIIPISYVIAEHRLYLPCVGFFLAFVLFLDHFIKDNRKNIFLLVVMVAALSVATFLRNKVWRTEESLWLDIVKKSPNKARTHYNLGNVYFDHHKDELALKSYDRSAALNNNFERPYINAGIIYMRQGNQKMAIKLLSRAVEIAPYDSEPYMNRGIAYKENGQYELALDDYNKAIKIDDTKAGFYVNRGVVYKIMGEYEKALSDYNKAIEMNPGLGSAYSNKGSVLLKMGRYADAVKSFSKSLEIDPDNAIRYYNRSLAYARMGDREKALQDALKARSLGWKVSDLYLKSLR